MKIVIRNNAAKTADPGFVAIPANAARCGLSGLAFKLLLTLCRLPDVCEVTAEDLGFDGSFADGVIALAELCSQGLVSVQSIESEDSAFIVVAPTDEDE